MIEMCDNRSVQGNRLTGQPFEVFCQFSSNGKTLRRNPVTNLAPGFPEQKPAKGVAGFSFVPHSGMPKSDLQTRIGKKIHDLFAFYTVRENIRPRWLQGKRGRLELDFFVEELDIAFEVQGDQHYVFTPFFHQTYDRFIEMQNRDAEKSVLCATHGVALYTISKEEELLFIHKYIDKLFSSALMTAREKHLEAFIYSRTWGIQQNLVGVEARLATFLAMNKKERQKMQKPWQTKVRKLRRWLRHFTLKLPEAREAAAKEFTQFFPVFNAEKPKAPRRVKVIKRTHAI
jgi:hypothetical protein